MQIALQCLGGVGLFDSSAATDNEPTIAFRRRFSMYTAHTVGDRNSLSSWSGFHIANMAWAASAQFNTLTSFRTDLPILDAAVQIPFTDLARLTAPLPNPLLDYPSP
ncbi:hypothetical protein CcaCcLH18_10946 [Colletotrichum camelliae]|nr:hypothetical protein CcaCcLH18_10946 [Colletotrichum camelliae]